MKLLQHFFATPDKSNRPTSIPANGEFSAVSNFPWNSNKINSEPSLWESKAGTILISGIILTWFIPSTGLILAMSFLKKKLVFPIKLNGFRNYSLVNSLNKFTDEELMIKETGKNIGMFEYLTLFI